jgi:hypothetical protein
MITKELVRRALEADVLVSDGHGLYPPTFYDGFFDVEKMGLVRTYKSDGTYKGTIFVNGEPVDEMNAVYNLDFLERLVRVLDLRPSSAMGRGFRASDYVNRLREWAYSTD